MHPWLVRYIVPADVPLIGGQDLSVPSLLFLAILGYMLATSVVIREADRSRLEPRRMLDLSLIFMAGGLVGGRLGHALIEAPRAYLAHPADLLDIWHGGVMLHAAIATSVALAAWYTRARGISLKATLDVFAPALSFGLVFGRLGTLAAGNGYGRPIDFPLGVEWPWGVVFYGGQVPTLLQGVSLHPAQLYLALMNLGLFIFLTRLRARQRLDGQVAAAWAVAFGLGRLALDAFRFDLDRVAGGLALTQLLSAALAVAGIGWLVAQRRAPAPEGA